MNNKKYQPLYDSYDYKLQLGNLIYPKKKRINASLDNSTSPSKGKLEKRRPTPYRPSTSESKLTTGNFNGEAEVLFNSNDSDYEDSATSDEEQNKEIGINSSNGFTSKLRKGVSSKNKSVRFSDTPKPKKNSIKRKSTPYHVHNKKVKVSTFETEKTVLFPSEILDIENEEDTLSVESMDVYSVSKSESPQRKKVKELFNTHKQKKLLTRDVNSHSKNISYNEQYMEVGELECDNKKYKNMSNSSYFLTEEGSDFENSDDLELDFTRDCNSSTIFGDISSIRNDDIESNNFEENEDILENLKLEPSDDENCEKAVEDNDLGLRKEVVGKADYFSLKDMLLIVLHGNSKIYFHGLMSVTVLQGAIEVLGYTLTTSSGCVEIFSPRGSSFLYFKTEEECVSSLVREDLINTLSTLGMQSETARELCQNLQSGSAMILCKEIIKSEITFLEKHTSQQVFPKGQRPMPQCIFQNNIDTWNVLKPSLEWDALANSVNYSTSKLFICGGKSVGKSTMLRYMMNKLLLKYPEILLIDLDPGQPEFTVSGCISATIVKDPVFGPNYTHLRKPSRCLFIPNINISYNPDGYLASVKELILSCSNLPKIPTIINYMGFTRGLGLEIFSAVVAYVQPTCMIEIHSSSSRRNFKKQLTHELICEKSKLLANTVDFIQKFPIHTIASMADANQGWHLEPRQIREMCVLSYLSKGFPQDVLSLTDSRVPVFVVNLSLIKTICNGEIVSPSVVNANLVALCSSRGSGTSYTCYGWGVVRGVNFTTNELFLVTPVSSDELEQVDHLILGSVSLPPSLYMTSDNNTGLVPFVSQGVLTTLGQIPKRSHLPPRHKQD